MNADITPAGPARGHLAAPSFTLRLTATPRGARLARRLTAEQLDRWGRPYDTDANRTAALLAAELAANAARHGRVPGRDFRLTLTLHRPEDSAAATLRIEVTDARTDRCPPPPGALRAPAPGAESGRGLLLVEALSARWGTTAEDPYTKTVWCEVPLGPGPGELA